MKTNLKKSLEEINVLISMLEIEAGYLAQTLANHPDLSDALQVFMVKRFASVKRGLISLHRIKEDLEAEIEIFGEISGEKENGVEISSDIIDDLKKGG